MFIIDNSLTIISVCYNLIINLVERFCEIINTKILNKNGKKRLYVKTSFISCCKNLLPKQIFNKKGLNVLYKSQNYIVINKESNLLTYTRNNVVAVQDSLDKKLKHEFPSLVIPKLEYGFYFVHRLDKVTSGVICVALNQDACNAACRAFRHRCTIKYYIALVKGHVGMELIHINKPVGQMSNRKGSLKRMAIYTPGQNNCYIPKTAETRLLLLERGYYHNYPASKVLLRPITGRQHQLRVHCSYLGHTIVGDYAYTNDKDFSRVRTFLHAYRLILPTPMEKLDIISTDPFLDCPNWITVESLNEIGTNAYKKLN